MGMNEMVTAESPACRLNQRQSVIEHAVRVFGSESKADRWLNQHSSVLAAKPIELLINEDGLISVEHELRRIDHGDFA